MTSSLDFEGELILDGVLLDKLETLTKKLQKATKKTDKSTILLDAKNEIGENPLFFFLDFLTYSGIKLCFSLFLKLSFSLK